MAITYTSLIKPFTITTRKISNFGRMLTKYQSYNLYDSFYPFGITITSNNNDNKYLYNGKELQDEFGLDWYDYGGKVL